jgi:hypothetical protein
LFSQHLVNKGIIDHMAKNILLVPTTDHMAVTGLATAPIL